MKAYRVSVNLKLGLILFAVAIAVSSLWYTKDLAESMQRQERFIIELWARALEQVVSQQTNENPFQDTFMALESAFQAVSPSLPTDEEGVLRPDRVRQALQWALTMPQANNLTFISSAFYEPNPNLNIPALLVDSSLGHATMWHNVPVDVESLAELDSLNTVDPVAYRRIRERLESIRLDMDAVHEPIPIVVTAGADTLLFQTLHYGESDLIRAVRWFPYVQLGVVSLFVLVGYFGFSYLRSSEQKSLWVGMAKEAAHQLGTPISSLMGWVEVLRMKQSTQADDDRAFDEIEKDIQRLTRVTSRFSDIGSLPKLERQPIAPVIENIAEYMRRRLPQSGKLVELNTTVADGVEAPINAELFEWVIENLIKNALDAMQAESGRIDVVTTLVDGSVITEVSDNGRGIDRRQWKNVFRPGYSTKKRGWGLGLSLARRIVEDYHGGSLVLAHSRPGEGTTFRITLPHRPSR